MTSANDLGQREGTILLVDDQPEQIDVIRAVLEKHFAVRIAINGSLALKIAHLGGLDLILLDIMMPGMDGYEVCRHLKDHSATRDIPVIFLTAKEGHEEESYGLSLGAADFIRKPGNPSVILARARNMVSLFRTRRELSQKNVQLETALKVREDIDQITRHDLKGPLSGILGVPQLLLEEGCLSEGQKALLKMVERSGYVMLDMINRSLDLVKMENGTYQLSLERVDLSEIINKIISDLGRQIDAKKLSIVRHTIGRSPEVDGNFFIIGEKLLCYPLFSNLILNAVEASPTGGKMAITLTEDGQNATVRITNQGEVPMAIHDRFFEKYVTLGKKKGTGLGTYSAWLAAKTQNGKIALDTVLPGETSILVTLPTTHPLIGS